MPTSTYKNNSHKSNKRSKSLSKKHKNSKKTYSNKKNNMRGGSRQGSNTYNKAYAYIVEREHTELMSLEDTLKKIESNKEITPILKTEYIRDISNQILRQKRFVKNIATYGYADAKDIENNLIRQAQHKKSNTQKINNNNSNNNIAIMAAAAKSLSTKLQHSKNNNITPEELELKDMR